MSEETTRSCNNWNYIDSQMPPHKNEEKAHPEGAGSACLDIAVHIVAGCLIAYVVIKVLTVLETIAAELVKLNETVGGLLKP